MTTSMPDAISPAGQPEPPPDVSVVIPAFNEEATIGVVVRGWESVLRALALRFEILVCDDASVDGSPAILENLSRSMPALRIVRNRVNRGHGPTVRQGYAEAGGTWVMQVDADGEVPAEEFARLWSQRHDYDLLLGVRTPSWSSRGRRCVSSGAGHLIRLKFGRGVDDVNCPFRLIRRVSLLPMLNEIHSNSTVPNVVMSGLAVRDGLRIFQAPVKHRERTGRPRRLMATAGLLARALQEVSRLDRRRRTP